MCSDLGFLNDYLSYLFVLAAGGRRHWVVEISAGASQDAQDFFIQEEMETRCESWLEYWRPDAFVEP